MIRLTVSLERVEDLFRTVKHDLFQKKKHLRWHVREDGSVRTQSVLWLFCWAENGDNREQKASDSRSASDSKKYIN